MVDRSQVAGSTLTSSASGIGTCITGADNFYLYVAEVNGTLRVTTASPATDFSAMVGLFSSCEDQVDCATGGEAALRVTSGESVYIQVG